jgi:long-chain acyl-CoA synthetase
MAAGNLADLIASAAATHGDKPALVEGAVTVTWAELDDRVGRAAAGLRERAARGDRVGILLPNSIDFAVAYFGALRAGLVAVPLNTAYTPGELSHQLSDSGLTLAVSDAELAGKLTDLAEDAKLVVGGGGSWEALLDGSSRADSSVGGGDDLALLLYTSGTSGRPRGAMLSHRALLANLDQLSRIDPPVVATDDVVLLVLPLFHIYGLNSGLGMVARAGATGVLAHRFDPVETLALVREHDISNIVGAPPMYVAWAMLPDLGESLSSVRLAVSGAAPLPASTLTAVLDASGHHVFEGYGLTETAPVLTTTLCSEVAKPGSVGRPIPGVELQIRDRVGREVEEDDPGEIVVRGDNLFSGYWPHGAGGPDSDGWFRTGDIAYADEDGDLHLVDRSRELILVSGFNVYPREVEAVLEQHPDVAEVAVIGIAHPYTGETVKAIVVPRDGATPSPDGLIEYAAEHLARFKCPTSVELVASLPHSLTGKVAKGRLREEAAAPEETASR